MRKAAPVAVGQLRAMVASCYSGTLAGVRNRGLLVLPVLGISASLGLAAGLTGRPGI